MRESVDDASLVVRTRPSCSEVNGRDASASAVEQVKAEAVTSLEAKGEVTEKGVLELNRSGRATRDSL